MVIIVDAATALVLTVNVALVAPAGTVTVEATVAAPVLLVESVTCAPAAGAGPLTLVAYMTLFRSPITVAGLSVSEASVGGGGGARVTVSEAVLATPP